MHLLIKFSIQTPQSLHLLQDKKSTSISQTCNQIIYYFQSWVIGTVDVTKRKTTTSSDYWIIGAPWVISERVFGAQNRRIVNVLSQTAHLPENCGSHDVYQSFQSTTFHGTNQHLRICMGNGE